MVHETVSIMRNEKRRIERRIVRKRIVRKERKGRKDKMRTICGTILSAAVAFAAHGTVSNNPAARTEVRLGKSASKVGRCRVMDSVNAGRKPARSPSGAGEFEMDRPRAHGGVVVNAADFGFSTTNDLNAAAIMHAIDSCRTAGASRLVPAPET